MLLSWALCGSQGYALTLFFTLNRDFVPTIIPLMSWAPFYPWCDAHSYFCLGCLQHRNRQREMREPVCPVTYPPGHGMENRKGRWIESSPNPRPNELNKVTELDKIVPLTFRPAVSALEAITSWLCFCAPASGLWRKAGSQLPLPRAARGAGGCSLQDRQRGGGFRCVVKTSKSLHFPLLWCYLGKQEPFLSQGWYNRNNMQYFPSKFSLTYCLRKEVDEILSAFTLFYNKITWQ